jgi:hypothetical protein
MCQAKTLCNILWFKGILLCSHGGATALVCGTAAGAAIAVQHEKVLR